MGVSAHSVTDWRRAGPAECREALRAAVPRVLCDSRAAELAVQCDNPNTLALIGPDGLLIVKLIPSGEALELFVVAAVATRFGAFKRQEPAVLQIARDLGASTIAFRAARRGWERAVGAEWTRRGTDEFVRIVDGRRQRTGNTRAEGSG